MLAMLERTEGSINFKGYITIIYMIQTIVLILFAAQLAGAVEYTDCISAER